MSTTTNVKQVKMNIMTQAQYSSITPSATELYMVTDAEVYSSFIGANGTSGGASGLVPAPAATDNTKFLKGDGTWAAVNMPVVDQTYSASSTNAQSGTAVAAGLDTKVSKSDIWYDSTTSTLYIGVAQS